MKLNDKEKKKKVLRKWHYLIDKLNQDRDNFFEDFSLYEKEVYDFPENHKRLISKLNRFSRAAQKLEDYIMNDFTSSIQKRK
jgi:hypothetical protein